MSEIIGALALCDLPGVPKVTKRQSVTRTADTIYRVENVPSMELFKTKDPKKLVEDESVFILVDADGNHNHLLVKRVMTYTVDQDSDQTLITLQFVGVIQEHTSIKSARVIVPVITRICQYRSILAIRFTPPLTVEVIDTKNSKPAVFINQPDWIKVITSEYGSINYLGRNYELINRYDAVMTTISDISGNRAICGEWAYYSDKTPIDTIDLDIVRQMTDTIK